MPQLLDMPTEVMSLILEDVDLKAILTLRKVCHDLRNFIDDIKPDIKLIGIEIRLRSDVIDVIYRTKNKDRYQIKYMKNQEYCLTTCKIKGDSIKIRQQRSTFVEAFLMDFELITRLRNQNSSILESFYIRKSDFSEEVYQRELRRIEGILKNRILKVTNFQMDVAGAENVLIMLPLLDPESLLTINLKGKERLSDCFPPMKIEEIVKLEQWKAAKQGKELVIGSAIQNFDIEDFKNFQRVSIRTWRIPREDLEAARESFRNLNSTSLRELLINYTTISDGEEFYKQFGAEYYSDNGEEDFDNLIIYHNWFFKIPDLEFLLVIQKYAYGAWHVKFFVEERKNIPEGAIIQEL